MALVTPQQHNLNCISLPVLLYHQGVRRRRSGKMLLADVTQEVINTVVSKVSTSSRSSSGNSLEGDMRPHFLVNTGELARAIWDNPDEYDMRRKENRLAKEKALSHGGNGGKCGFPGCAISFPKRPRNRCNACDKYFHNGCFWRCHVATELGDDSQALLKKPKNQ